MSTARQPRFWDLWDDLTGLRRRGPQGANDDGRKDCLGVQEDGVKA
jgi:hypothetical protein